MFVFSTTLLCIYVFGFCWVYIKRIMVLDDTTIWKAMIKTPASIVLIAYTFISVWFVGGLTAFHLYLISTNQVCSWIVILFFPLSIWGGLDFDVNWEWRLFFGYCRLLMRILDTDMIGVPIPTTEEWCRISRRYFVLVFLHPRTISVQRCPGNPRWQLDLQVGVLWVQTWGRLWRT